MAHPLGPRHAIEALSRRHDRGSFSSAAEPLDRYLRRQAMQDVRRDVASVFVAIERGSGAVHGFYTLSMAAVALDRLPERLARKMPRYPTLPAVRLGRLAVHRAAQGRRLGTHLLMDAMARSLRSEVAWAAFLVEALDERVRGFYEPFGFRSFEDDPTHLFLMRRTIESVLG